MTDPTARFSSRVESYIKYRPRYPEALLELLAAECGLTGESAVADIGSGTGILTELLLRGAGRVYGVEPNAEMRAAAERLLAAYPGFVSVAAPAEATTLPDASVDLIAAGQAFHWFDRERARVEFERVLRPGGSVALVWNQRRTGGTPFLEAYERLLREYGTDYAAVADTYPSARDVSPFFGPGGCRERVFENRQVFDLEGFLGRNASSSFMPEPGHPRYEATQAALRELFHAQQEGGVVTFLLDTVVYYGRLT
jgi:SAM-dependent methyltransferase